MSSAVIDGFEKGRNDRASSELVTTSGLLKIAPRLGRRNGTSVL
jgi:hypothetical protein